LLSAGGGFSLAVVLGFFSVFDALGESSAIFIVLPTAGLGHWGS
jgi:hypothetical protein